MNPKVTLFTPTFNRAHTLPNLYRSLQRQTSQDFEWLILDDGSTDETATLVARWQREGNLFPIRYARQENGGKCRAINHGLRLAACELFCIVDSDDHLTADALEKIIHWEASLPKDGTFCGISANLGTDPETTPNFLFEGTWLDGTALDRYRNLTGERIFAFYTQIHRRYPYPEFPGENFMTEAVAWNRMAADGYRIRFFNDILCVYAYREDGLTRAGNRLFLKNPRGYGLWLREKSLFLKASPWQIFRIYYSFYCELSGTLSLSQMARCIGASYGAMAAAALLHRFKQLLPSRHAEKTEDKSHADTL